jgi:hypothetical protein
MGHRGLGFLKLLLLIGFVLGSAHAVSAGTDEGIEALRAGDVAKAKSEFEGAAKQGDARAMYLIGRMNHEGRGVPVNEAEAAKWYKQAAEKGNADAQNALGTMYTAGKPMTRDNKAAAKWFEAAAKQDHPAAMPTAKA